MLLKLKYRFILFSIIIKLNITDTSTVQYTQGWMQRKSEGFGAQHMLSFTIKSAKTITTLDPMF